MATVASKKKVKKKTTKKSAKKSRKSATASRSDRKKVALHVFVKPIGAFTHAANDQPGIRVSDDLLRLAALASKATVRIRKHAPSLEMSAKLDELLDKLYAKAVPGGPALLKLKPPSCWNEKTKEWEPGLCPAANAVFSAPPSTIQGADAATWRFLIGLQVDDA